MGTDAIAVRECDPDAIDLAALLGSDAGNLVYADPAFLSFLRVATSARIHLLVAERSGTLVGALPYAVFDRPGVGRLVNSLPWYGSHGGVVLDRSDARSASVREVLLAAFAARIRDLDPLSATVILLPDEEPFRDVYDRHLRPTSWDFRVTQVTDLPTAGPDVSDATLEASLLGSFRQKTRNLVRKALAQGFEEHVSDDDDAWSFLYETHAANMAALGGRAKPRSHFAALRACIPSGIYRLTLARDNGLPVAAMLTLTYNAAVEYLIPAVKVEYRSRQPASFLIVKAMMAAARQGVRRWNWGGTWGSQSTLHRFKAGFGAVDRPYSYVVRASAEGLADFRERRAELQDLFPFFYVYPFAALETFDRRGADQLTPDP